MLPSEWSCAFTELLSDDNQKGYNIPLVKSDPFPYLALFGISYCNTFFQKNKVVIKKLQNMLNYVPEQVSTSWLLFTQFHKNPKSFHEVI